MNMLAFAIKKYKPLAMMFGYLFFFTLLATAKSESPDAIAVRVVPNPNHISALQWYGENILKKGNPQTAVIDGYSGIVDGRTIYINASNLETSSALPKLYTNIYIISHNQEPEANTVSIFGKILENWSFNENIAKFSGVCSNDAALQCDEDDDCGNKGYCNSIKAKAVRDTLRMENVNLIRKHLQEYFTKNGHYPLLRSGTYLKGNTISAWPSWNNTLSREIGSTLPMDPINDLSPCIGYNEQTCWNEINKTFAWTSQLKSGKIPSDNLIYSYSTDEEGLTYKLCSYSETGLMDSAYACNEKCVPFCYGRNCGDDGCGGSCGSCPPLESCNSGVCAGPCGTAPGCRASLANAEVVGGTCAGGLQCYECLSGFLWDGASCKATCVPDGCNGSCPSGCGPAEDPDCGAAGCCGDGTCDVGESSATCLIDCPLVCIDNDGDGYGSPGSPVCAHPETDCDDFKSSVNPGAAEILGNGLDDNCNGLVDEISDIVPPSVNTFSVTPLNTASIITAEYSISDNLALLRAELWRTSDLAGAPDPLSWIQISINSHSGTISNGSFVDNPPDGAWWYGVHAVDSAGNWADEPPPGPIRIMKNSSGVCLADGCNGVCPANCAPSQDPDCAGTGCCGDGSCGSAEDSGSCAADCPDPCALMVKIDSPPDGKESQGGALPTTEMFSAQSFGGSPPYSFKWSSDLNGEFLSDQSGNPAVSTFDIGEHAISVQVTDSLGAIASDSIKMTFHDADFFVNAENFSTEWAAWAFVSAIAHNGTDPITYKWQSDLEGDFSNFQFDNLDISAWAKGIHKITVTATDKNGQVAQDSYDVAVKDLALITWSNYVVSEEFHPLFMQCRVEGGLPDYTVSWTSDKDGLINAVSQASDFFDYQTSGLSLGCHKVTVTATDSKLPSNNTDMDFYFVQILPFKPIEVEITSPINGATIEKGISVAFKANIGNGVWPYKYYKFESDLSGIIKEENGAFFSENDIYLNINNLAVGDHNITLTVNDTSGHSGSDSIDISILPPQPLAVTIDSPADGSSYKKADDLIIFSATSTGGVSPYSFEWSSSIDGPFSDKYYFGKNDLSQGSHAITLKVTDSDGTAVTKNLNINIVPSCIGTNTKDFSKYSPTESFLITSDNWRDVLQLVPITVWKEGATVKKYPALVYHQEAGGFDIDSIIHFLQQYGPDHLTTIGAISVNANNVLIAAQPTGAGIDAADISNISSADYFSYWSGFENIVLADLNDYQAGLLASILASNINAPLLFINATNLGGYAPLFNGRSIFSVGNLDAATQNEITARSACYKNYGQDEFIKWHAAVTNSDKLMLVNPNDLTIEVAASYLTEKNGGINRLFGANSLAAPFLAAAKAEMMGMVSLNNPGGNSGCTMNPNIQPNIDAVLAKSSDYIKNYFINSKPAYLTIIASHRAIPDSNFSGTCSGSYQFRKPFDWKYANLDNSIYPNPNTLLYGRIYGLTISDTSAYIARDLFYDDFIDKVYALNEYTGLSIAHDFGEINAKVLKEKTSGGGYDSVCFTGNTIDGCTKSLNPSASWYKKRQFITFFDHGGPQSWCLTLSSSNITWLDLPFVFGHACLTNNAWQGEGNTFGVHMLRKGSIGYVGAVSVATVSMFSENELRAIKLLTNDSVKKTIGYSFVNSADRIYFILLGDPTLVPKFKQVNWD